MRWSPLEVPPISVPVVPGPHRTSPERTSLEPVPIPASCTPPFKWSSPILIPPAPACRPGDSAGARKRRRSAPEVRAVRNISGAWYPRPGCLGDRSLRRAYDSDVSAIDDPGAAAANAVTDLLGRPLHDLRISVTDRCNFRCTYCMPKEIFGPDFAFLPRDQVLTLRGDRAARARVRRSSASEKLRITGGEPLVRRDLPVLIGMLAAIRRPDGGPLDLTLTTNGSALRRLAGAAPRRRAADGSPCQPRLARRRDVRSDERGRLPGRQGPRRDRRGAGGRARADQDQHGRPPRDRTRRASCRWRAGRARPA